MFTPKRCPNFSALTQLLEGLAPSRLAGKWDNVGILVDVSAAAAAERQRPVYSVMFTNDLTPAVLHEAVTARVNAIVTYHPTPFVPLKKFSLGTHAAAVVLQCAHAGIGVYAPHTAWDSVKDGLNDWLATGIARCALPDITAALSVAPVKPSENPEDAARGCGDGRMLRWPLDAAPLTLAGLIVGVKAHLGLSSVQVALPMTAELQGMPLHDAAARVHLCSYAVVAGSGASILSGVDADAYVTGEMSHHDVLAATAAGRAVVLTNHSNCERGFLRVMGERLAAAWRASAESMELRISYAATDADPLITV